MEGNCVWEDDFFVVKDVSGVYNILGCAGEIGV